MGGQAGAVSDDGPTAAADELERLGLYDPTAPDAAERLELMQLALQRGATLRHEMVAVKPTRA